MTKSVLAVSRLTPTFSAQTVMDTSFLWQQAARGDIISDHHQSFRNLDPEHEISTGEIFDRGRPAGWRCSRHALWGVAHVFRRVVRFEKARAGVAGGRIPTLPG